MRWESGFMDFDTGVPPLPLYARTAVFCSVVLWILFTYNGLYQRGFRFNSDYGWRLFENVFIGFLCFSSLAFFYRDAEFSRTFFLLSFANTFTGMSVYSLIRYKMLKNILPGLFQFSRILVIGTGDRAVQLYHSLQKSGSNLSLAMIGPSTIHLPANINFLGSLEQFSRIAEEHDIDEVILALPEHSEKQCLKIISECQNRQIRFSVLPELFNPLTRQLSIGDVMGVPVVPVGRDPGSRRLQNAMKRIFDFSASLASIMALSPLLFIIWILVKLEDGGPLFYKQERVGMNGQTFWIYKFRSMRQDAETKSGPMWAIQGDPRWTRVGTILRRTSIDELPQLWNVIKGEMSLVGPRPERPIFVNEFKQRIPGYMLRHRVRGGLTGWAQVNGLRGQTSIEDRTTYDLYYIENWSFLFDLRIIFQTVFKAVFIQSGY